MVKVKTAKRTSKVKLGNKASNKKNKHPGTNKDLEKFQFKKKAPRNTPIKKHAKKEAEKIDYTRHNQHDDDSEMDLEDGEFSDDDMKTYLGNNSQNMSFLSQNLSGVKEKRRGNKKDDGADISLFEVVPRKSSNLYDVAAEKQKETVDLLPIKGEKGLIKRKGERIQQGLTEESQDEAENADENNVQMEAQPVSVIEIIAAHREEVNQKKLKIAQMSMDIVENPNENINKLKQLLDFSDKEEVTTIRKLSLLSLLEIFKDIIPSYRIRELSDEERGIKVSRDVRKIREYEENLLRSYQNYLQTLEENIRGCVKFVKKRRRNHNEKHFKGALSLAITSVKCLSELIKIAPHFNFRKNIISVLVPNIEQSKELSEVGDICFNAIKSALLSDYSGNVAFDIVQMIQRLTKTKSNLNPKVLEALLYLRVDADLIHATEQKGNKVERIKAKQEALKKLSRKEKKRKRVEDKLNKELQEVEAVENQDRIGKTHTEVLKLLFVIYFRVLKLGHKSSLLTVVLKGLARFSHLINLDFFGDLMNCLESVLKYEDLDIQDRLHCILTALKVLSGQGDALTIDPRHFYTELYNVLLTFDSDMNSTCFHSMKQCLDIMLIKRRKQVSHPQILGYLKRISTMLLQMPSERLSEMLLLLRSIFQLYEKCDYLLDNESFGRGVFQPEITNPEHSNADSTALWELQLLTRCYQGDAETYCKHIMNGAPSHGSGCLPQRLLQRGSVKESISASFDAPEYFETLPDKAVVKRKPGEKREAIRASPEEEAYMLKIRKDADLKMQNYIAEYSQTT